MRRSRSAPEGFAELVARLAGGGLRRGQRHRAAQARRRSALADRASESARAIGAANTLTFTEAGVEAANTDAAGLLGALPEPPGRHAAPSFSAPAAPPGPRSGPCARPAPRSRSGTGRPSARAELAEAFDVAVGSGADFDLLVNCTTVGLVQASERPPDARRPKAVADRCRCDLQNDKSWWTWSTARTTRRCSPRERPRGARRRRARGAGPPGSRLASHLDRTRSASRCDERGGPSRYNRSQMASEKRPGYLRPVPSGRGGDRPGAQRHLHPKRPD